MRSDANPGLGALADHVLDGVQGEEERRAWRWLLAQMEPYPPKLVPALKPPSRTDAPKRLIVAEIQTEGSLRDGTPRPVALRLDDGLSPSLLPLPAGAEGALALAGALFTHRHRGALLVLPDGAASSFAVLLRAFARHLAAMGFQIEPLTGGATVRGIIVRKARHSWVLADLGIMVGMEGIGIDAFNAAFGGWEEATLGADRLSHRALTVWQSLSLEHFDAAASVTVGRSAVRAASRHLGRGQWLWRTHPLAVALLRAGGGYRGGYAAAHRYVGQAWRMDMNKAYAWALGEPLPSRLGLYRAAPGHEPPPGIYVARITGDTRVPLYVGRWSSERGGFERALWLGGDTLAVVTTTEAAAMRRLGYRVTFGTGLAYLSTFTLSGFTASIAGITRMYPRNSAQERIARAYGVAVYGKLAERPERQQTMYSAASPGEAWLPFVTNTGNEIDDLWQTATVAHRPHQHVDVAAEVTSLVRARLYDAMGAVIAQGGKVPHADTDGFLTTIDPAALFSSHATEPGAWRVPEGPERAIVWGSKGYSFGDEVRAAGLRGVTSEQAESIIMGEAIDVDMTRRASPFGDAPLYQPLRRQVKLA